jgi:hypothetical protein
MTHVGVTHINAGFAIAVKTKGKPSWINKQCLAIPLPRSMFGETEFTREVIKLAPAGYILQGYCLAKFAPTEDLMWSLLRKAQRRGFIIPITASETAATIELANLGLVRLFATDYYEITEKGIKQDTQR